MEFLQRAGLVEPGWTMAMQVVNFIILYAVLKHFLFVPVVGYLENRRKKIERELSEAGRKSIEAVELLNTYSNKIDSIKKEGRAIIDESRQNAEEKAAEIVAIARQEASIIRDKAGRDLKEDRQAALKEARSEIVGIAMQAAEKIIGESLDESKSKSLIDEFIDEVEGLPWDK